MATIDPATREAAEAFLAKLADRYDVKEAVLFGSRARNDHRPESDADVAVLLRGPRRRTVAVALDMVESAYDVELDTEIVISPLPIWEEQWAHPETHSNPDLLHNIRREGVPL